MIYITGLVGREETTMAEYTGKLILILDLFEADSLEEADAMVDAYVDEISNNHTLSWSEVDWKLEEVV